MKFALVFPGQGSQAVGMMAAYGESAIIRDTFAEASAALGRDLWQLVCEGPAEALAQTVNTQPLMLTAGVAVYREWLAKGGPKPAAVAGHSLGEYSALVAAGALAFADAVPPVELRAKAMQEAVPQGVGAMAAIMGLEADVVREVCAEAAQGECVEAVNLNSPGQIVIAGHAAAVNRAGELAKSRGAKRALLLPVSAPFHCALMKPAADKLALRLADVAISVPTITVVNNVDVATYDDPAKIRDALIRQAHNPVRWIETMQAFGDMGISNVYECGPGKVLSGMVKRCDGRLAGAAISDGATLEAALAAVAG